jgi:hypothetical protein
MEWDCCYEFTVSLTWLNLTSRTELNGGNELSEITEPERLSSMLICPYRCWNQLMTTCEGAQHCIMHMLIHLISWWVLSCSPLTESQNDVGSRFAYRLKWSNALWGCIRVVILRPRKVPQVRKADTSDPRSLRWSYIEIQPTILAMYAC